MQDPKPMYFHMLDLIYFYWGDIEPGCLHMFYSLYKHYYFAGAK